MTFRRRSFGSFPLIVAILLLMSMGCDQLSPPAPSPAPAPTERQFSEEEPSPPAETVVAPVSPVEPRPEPTPPPTPQIAAPAIQWRELRAIGLQNGRTNGTGFRVTFIVIANRNQVPIRLTLIDRDGNALPALDPDLVGNIWGIEYFAEGAGSRGAPYRVSAAYHDSERDEWITFTPWAELGG